MIFKEPKMEFVSIKMSDVITTSGCSDGVMYCPDGSYKSSVEICGCTNSTPGEYTGSDPCEIDESKLM